MHGITTLPSIVLTEYIFFWISSLWASEGAKHFFDLAFSEKSAESGANLITGYEVMNGKKVKMKYKLLLNLHIQNKVHTLNIFIVCLFLNS